MLKDATHLLFFLHYTIITWIIRGPKGHFYIKCSVSPNVSGTKPLLKTDLKCQVIRTRKKIRRKNTTWFVPAGSKPRNRPQVLWLRAVIFLPASTASRLSFLFRSVPSPFSYCSGLTVVDCSGLDPGGKYPLVIKDQMGVWRLGALIQYPQALNSNLSSAGAWVCHCGPTPSFWSS